MAHIFLLNKLTSKKGPCPQKCAPSSAPGGKCPLPPVATPLVLLVYYSIHKNLFDNFRRRRRVEHPDDANYFPSAHREIQSPTKAIQPKPRTTPALKMHSLDGDYREEAGEPTKQDDFNKDPSRCHGNDCYDNRNCFKNGTSHVNCYPEYDRPSNTFGFNYRDNSGTCAPHIWQTPLPQPVNLRNVVDAEM